MKNPCVTVWEAAVEELDETFVGLLMIEVEPAQRVVAEWGEFQRSLFPSDLKLQPGTRVLVTVRPGEVKIEDYWLTERAKRLERSDPDRLG